MAVFDPKSRYVEAELVPYETVDAQGRTVLALPVPDAPVQALAGEHIKKQGQRLDHLAHAYLGDANGFWRICEINDAMVPDALAEAETVKIPKR
jgi:hypothetical protein